LLGVGLAQIASAADMPVKAPVYKAPMMAPAYNWSGFYIGGVVGYGWGTSDHCDASTCGLPGVVYPAPDPKGWNAGVTLGYNWQSANWVLGVEGDWSWANMKGSDPGTLTFGCAGTCDTNIKSFGTVRGRIGYAFDRLLPYVTAGVAFTELNATIGTPVLAEGTTTKASFTVGGGVEYAFLPNWSAKLEYLYISKLDDFTYAPAFCAAPGCFVSNTSYSVARLGVNYRFAGGL
jgi:outer membrane immunogenic protein